MTQRPIPLDMAFAPDGSIKLMVPKTAGVRFEEAAARIQSFADSLAEELGVKVVIEGVPEMHVHGPGETVRTHGRART